MVVTIDGPAGAGKSSLARRRAASLGFGFLDTGAMYRGVTLACIRSGVNLDDPLAIARCAAASDIRLLGDEVWLDGEDITTGIRTPEVTRAIRPVADNRQVRELLVERQRQIVGDRDFVTEGRDQATVAFPNAQCKIFLTASPAERAERRRRQLAVAGIERSLESILSEQQIRDAEDTRRSHGGLVVAEDAIYVHTDGMHEQQVLDKLIEIVRTCRRGASPATSN